MSSAAHHSVSVAKTPFLSAAALFLGVAALVFALAIKPLGAAELVGLLACVAAASVFATIPFVVDHTRRSIAFPREIPAATPPLSTSTAPALDADRLAAQIAAAVESAVDARLASTLPDLAAQITASLAATEEKRRAELQAALAATTPARPVDSDTVSAPAGAKPRLGRGLLGLMHAPSALTAKAPGEAPASSEDERAAA